MKGLPKIDFKKVAMQTAGEAGGLFALNALGKVKFVANAKPGMKGVIYKAIAALAPGLISKAKKGNELMEGAANTLSVAGTSQLMAAFMPGKVTAIGGYEDAVIQGPGYEFEEGSDDPNVSGDEEVMS